MRCAIITAGYWIARSIDQNQVHFIVYAVLFVGMFLWDVSESLKSYIIILNKKG